VVLTTPTTTPPLATARVDNPDKLQYDPSGKHFKIKHVMYIEDAQTAQIHSQLGHLNLLIASSLKSVYILLGYSGPIEEPYSTPSVAFDKIVEALGVFSTFLGLNIHTNDLTVETPARRIQRLREILLRHWNHNQKSFIARQAAQLIGNFVSCLQGCHWLKLLAFEFTRLLRTSLSRNSHRLIGTKHFDALLNEPSASWLEPTAGQRNAKLLGLKSEYARALWCCKQSTWIPKAAHEDQAAYLVELIDKHLRGKCRWYKPISHIVQRKEDQLQ
jgi:hypothetical protein